MIHAAAHSRLFELRRDRAAAHRSAELLDRKREVLLRELLRRERLLRDLRDRAANAYADAHQKLRIARVDLGIDAIESAALAQPAAYAMTRRESSVMGVRIPELSITTSPYRACYGAATTSESLDECGAAFAELLPRVVACAQEEIAVARLSAAVRKTTKLLHALQKIVIPRIERDIRMIVDGIEEDERDEALRRRTGARTSRPQSPDVSSGDV